MPDDVVVNDPTPAPVTPEPTPVDAAPVPEPRQRPNTSPTNSGEAFDNTVAEAKAEIEAQERAKEEAAKKAAEPVVEEEEEEEEEAKTKEPVKKEPEEEEEEEEDADKPKEAAPEEDKTTDADRVLALLKNPELLQRALEQAGVASALELPFIKDVLGRNSQSVADQIKNEVDRQQWEAANIQGVMVEGRRAQNEAIDVMVKLAKDFEEGVEDVVIPDAKWLEERFNKYADGAVHAYHNQNFAAITERVYKWPEYQNLTNAEKAELASVDGQPPAEWIDKHLEVGRNKLWQMAQRDVADKAQKYVENEVKLATEAHKVELEKVNAKWEKKLDKAISKAVEEARASQLVEQATKGSPPKTPKKVDVAVTVDDDEVDYSSFETIAASVKRQLEKGAGSGV